MDYCELPGPHAGVTCEGKSVLFHFLLEVFDLKVPLLQQLVQSPVLIHCLPEFTTKLLDFIFQHPARERWTHCSSQATVPKPAELAYTCSIRVGH